MPLPFPDVALVARRRVEERADALGGGESPAELLVSSQVHGELRRPEPVERSVQDLVVLRHLGKEDVAAGHGQSQEGHSQEAAKNTGRPPGVEGVAGGRPHDRSGGGAERDHGERLLLGGTGMMRDKF